MHLHGVIQLAVLNVCCLVVKSANMYGTDGDANNRLPRQIRFRDNFAPAFGKRLSPGVSNILQRLGGKTDRNIQNVNDLDMLSLGNENRIGTDGFDHRRLDRTDQLLHQLIRKYRKLNVDEPTKSQFPVGLLSRQVGSNVELADDDSYGVNWGESPNGVAYR